MGDSYDANFVAVIEVDDEKWKTTHHETPGPCKYSGQRWGAFTIWRIASDTVTRNSTPTLGLRLRYHPIASRKSCRASE